MTTFLSAYAMPMQVTLPALIQPHSAHALAKLRAREFLFRASCVARRMHAPISAQYSSFPNILYLYFEHHSKCQIEIPTLCARCRYSFCLELSLSVNCCCMVPPRGARCRAPQGLFVRESYCYKCYAGSSVLLSLFHIPFNRNS